MVERDEPRHELRGGRHGVFQLRAHGAVPARAVYREAQFVAGGHVFPGAESQRPDLQLRLDVFAHHGTYLVPFERVFGQYQRRPARVALFARLEQPEERAAEVGFGGELLQYPEEYSRVHVVAAGVHDAGVARPPTDVVLFGDRQGVDVGAQHYGAAFGIGFPVPFDSGQYARPGDGTVFDA